MPEKMVLIYTTFPDAETANSVGEALVREKLAACVNVHAPMTSLYEWQGELTKESEVAAIVKTRASLADAAIAFARARHPYTVPCFLVLPVESANEDYLAWLLSQTKSSAS